MAQIDLDPGNGSDSGSLLGHPTEGPGRAHEGGRASAERSRADEQAPTAPNAAGGPHWSPPLDLSGWQFFGEGAELEMGPDGTQAALWDNYNPDSGQIELWVNVYSPDLGWSGAEKLDPKLQWASMDIAPDGTVWVMRGITDTVQGKAQVVMSWRHPGATWQSEPISDWETILRGVDLHIGPDGDMAAAWVACDKLDFSNLADGTCAVRVRRRPVGALDWEPATRVDNSGAGVWEIHTRVGPGGMTVVLWTEAAALNPDSWAVTARTCAGGVWSPGPANVSGWIEPRRLPNWLAEPVMGIDGTAVVAWYAKTSPGSAQDAQYSATREPGGTWSTPVQISAAHDASACWKPTLALGQGGAAVAAWECTTSGSQEALFANVRDAGSAWGAETQVSGSVTRLSLYDLGVWPGGTAMILWGAQDTSLPATADEALFWSARPPSGNWGNGGEGRLGDWVDYVWGGALELGSDGSAFALWTISRTASRQRTGRPVGPGNRR
jgi:hypothetical protein